MENTVSHSMLDQPKKGWRCDCGNDNFKILLCPECEGEDAHIIGFECTDERCGIIHMTPTGAAYWEEHEDAVH